MKELKITEEQLYELVTDIFNAGYNCSQHSPNPNYDKLCGLLYSDFIANLRRGLSPEDEEAVRSELVISAKIKAIIWHATKGNENANNFQKRLPGNS